ncbi:ABC transporter permease [Gordonia sp. NB41Y]|uniref:ABC transporter permease n=1 Tax=Gordonia sp. NB41Y TaxID=875808 RepID=UPI0002BD4DFB|nr:ABC transporter permease [Gordonia sp. NB41Y]EMP14765.1 ABC transporter permease [Gordonia sp. NB41Y]WLP92114.1 ABC transporter permease [Gordonia sp. NB41Y]
MTAADVSTVKVVDAEQLPGPRVQGRRVVAVVAAKLGSAVFVLWGAITLTFVVLSVLPGDRAAIVLNIQSGQTTTRSAAEIAAVDAQYGWDRPLVVQYFSYLANVLRGDFGTSWELRRPVTAIIGEQIGPTLTLTVSALLLAWLISIPWTLLTAGRSRRTKTVGSAVETITAGLPQYWLGVILLLVFAVNLRLFPVIGGVGFVGTVLPAFTLAIPLAGFIGQATRTEFDRAIRQPFVLSARTRGMSDNGVRLRHVLRHALIPGITLSGWAMGALLSGAVLVESVFARPGIGAVLVKSVSDKDFELVMGIVILISAVYVTVNLLVDVIYTVIDPRLGGSR